MIVYFQDAVYKTSIDLGLFGKSGMDVSPMDIPLKGDVISDDYGNLWEVVGRQHYWNGLTHNMALHLKRM